MIIVSETDRFFARHFLRKSYFSLRRPPPNSFAALSTPALEGCVSSRKPRRFEVPRRGLQEEKGQWGGGKKEKRTRKTWSGKESYALPQGSVNGGFQTVVRVWSGEQIPAPHLTSIFYLNFTSVLHLFLTSFYLNLTSAQPAISNHGLETTVYTPLVTL